MVRPLAALIALGPLVVSISAGLPDIPNPGVPAYPHEVGTYGGTFVVGQISDPRTFNVLVAQGDPTADALAAIFDALVEVDYLTGEIVPALAESWTVSEDGRTWVFTLRQGVRWHDGRTLTVDDVLFTFQAIFTQGVRTAARDALTFEGAPLRFRALDARRVEIRTEKPTGTLLHRMVVPIVPRHKLVDILEKGGAEFNRAWDVTTPPRDVVGTGPFVLQEYIPGQRMTFRRNPMYWKVDKAGNRLPYLTRYVRLIVPDRETLRRKFLTRETDFYAARPGEFPELKRLERQGSFTMYDGPAALSSDFVVFNQNPAGVKAPRLHWFQDVRFRRALNHAVDRNGIVNQVYAGRATPGWGPVSPGNARYYDEALPRYEYSVTRAAQLLVGAGYRKGGDGVLRDPQGNTVEFTLATNAENPDRLAIATILQRDWAKLGIRLTVAPEALNTLIGKLVGTFNWEAAIIGLRGTLEPLDAKDVWLSTGSLHIWRPKQGKPVTAWEEKIDRIFSNAEAEADSEKRRQAYLRWQQIVAEQVPVMYVGYPRTQPVVRRSLGNAAPIGLPLGDRMGLGPLETLFMRTPSR